MIENTGRRWLRTPEAATYIGSSVSSMEKARLTGRGAPYSKLGRTVVYSIDDLDTFMALQRRVSTSDGGTK